MRPTNVENACMLPSLAAASAKLASLNAAAPAIGFMLQEEAAQDVAQPEAEPHGMQGPMSELYNAEEQADVDMQPANQTAEDADVEMHGMDTAAQEHEQQAESDKETMLIGGDKDDAEMHEADAESAPAVAAEPAAATGPVTKPVKVGSRSPFEQ